MYKELFWHSLYSKNALGDYYHDPFYFHGVVLLRVYVIDKNTWKIYMRHCIIKSGTTSIKMGYYAMKLGHNRSKMGHYIWLPRCIIIEICHLTKLDVQKQIIKQYDVFIWHKIK